MTNNHTFLLDKQNFTQSHWAEQAIHTGENQVLLKVDRVALTSNNATYAMLGQQLHYWDFFQSYAPDAQVGVLPVWGFAEVVESNVEAIAKGERYYGFWPFAQYALVTPEKITESGFLDATPPKPNLALAYRSFQKLSGLSPKQECFNALFRPLGTTAWLLANELAKKVATHGVSQVILSSASSKTALATAGILKAILQSTNQTVKLTGLTSTTNQVFVENTGFFDDVSLYDDVNTIITSPNSIYVDFSGSVTVRNAVHQRFQANLFESINVGATDWLGVTKKQAQELPGPTPYMFFAPTVYQETAKAIGPAKVASEIEKSMQFLGPMADNMTIKEVISEADITAVWDSLLAGKIAANEAIILRL